VSQAPGPKFSPWEAMGPSNTDAMSSEQTGSSAIGTTRDFANMLNENYNSRKKLKKKTFHTERMNTIHNKFGLK
jgi:hypothetical protein